VLLPFVIRMTSTPDIPNPTPSHTRLMQLDVLRGVAILMVLLRHSSPKWALLPYYDAGPLSRIMLFVGNIGWTGVDLFFVLSGFLIGGLLFREIKKTGRLDVRRFFIRRGLKIWPAYFFFLLVVLILASREIGFRAAFHALIPNFIHLQNYLGSPHGITWSLAVEEHFYLALPLFLLVIIPRRRDDGSMPAIPIAAAVLIVVCTALRFTNWNRPFDMYIQQTPTHLRIDGLFFGVLLAYLFHIKPALLARIARHRLALLVLGAALLAPMGFYDVPDHRWIWTIGYTMIYVGYGCILIACLFSPPGDLLGNLLASRPAAVLAWVGVFSYSIYLWQFEISYIPIHKWVLRRLPHHPLSLYWLVGTAIYLLAAILGGALLARIVEFPVLKLRDRLFPARADAVPVAPAAANEAESSTLLPVVSASN
jgi:peptidoglycan/LPS O-acetylase OafA/YrhL